MLDKKNRATLYQINVNIENENDPRSIVCSYIEQDSTVLDVGCACGDLGLALKAKKNCTLHGLEYNEGSIKIASQTGAYEEVSRINLNEYDENMLSQYVGKFDYIVFADVLEHLLEPQKVLDKFKKYLKKEGFIIISFPNISHGSIKANLLINDFTYTDLGFLDKTHLKFFTYKSIPSFLSEISLKILECRYTAVPIEGWQPKNAYLQLPKQINKRILNDLHSYVCQYVVKIQNCENIPIEKLKKINETNIPLNKNNAPKYLIRFKKEAVKKYLCKNIIKDVYYWINKIFYKYIVKNEEKYTKYKLLLK